MSRRRRPPKRRLIKPDDANYSLIPQDVLRYVLFRYIRVDVDINDLVALFGRPISGTPFALFLRIRLVHTGRTRSLKVRTIIPIGCMSIELADSGVAARFFRTIKSLRIYTRLTELGIPGHPDPRITTRWTPLPDPGDIDTIRLMGGGTYEALTPWIIARHPKKIIINDLVEWTNPRDIEFPTVTTLESKWDRGITKFYNFPMLQIVDAPFNTLSTRDGPRPYFSKSITKIRARVVDFIGGKYPNLTTIVARRIRLFGTVAPKLQVLKADYVRLQSVDFPLLVSPNCLNLYIYDCNCPLLEADVPGTLLVHGRGHFGRVLKGADVILTLAGENTTIESISGTTITVRLLKRSHRDALPGQYLALQTLSCTKLSIQNTVVLPHIDLDVDDVDLIKGGIHGLRSLTTRMLYVASLEALGDIDIIKTQVLHTLIPITELTDRIHYTVLERVEPKS